MEHEKILLPLILMPNASMGKCKNKYFSVSFNWLKEQIGLIANNLDLVKEIILKGAKVHQELV